MNEFGMAPQFECNEGILHIKSTLMEVRIRWQPNPLAEEKDRRGRWKEVWPEFRLIGPMTESGVDGQNPESMDKQVAFAAFRETVPQEFCGIVERFESHQWVLLKLLADCPSIRDLATASPVLAYALANNAELRQTTRVAGATLAVMHSHARQRDILEWLGFPGTQAMAGMFRKILPGAVSPSALRMLRLTMQKDGARVLKLLAHQKQINLGIMELVIYPVLRSVTGS